MVVIGTAASDGYQYLVPRLENTAKMFENDALVLTVDYMVVPEVYWELPTPQVPAVIVFRNGQIIDTFVTTIASEVDERIQKAIDSKNKWINIK